MKPRSNQSKIWVHKTSLTPPLFMEVPVPIPEIQRSCIWHRFCLFPRFFGWNLELFPLWLFCIFVFYFIIQELTWDCYFLTWDCYFLPWDWYFLIWDCYFSTWDCYYFFYLCLLTNSTILLSVRPFWTMTVDVTFILGCSSLLYTIKTSLIVASSKTVIKT